MRNLMLVAFALFAAVLFARHGLGNTGLWIALPGLPRGARHRTGGCLCPRLTRATFSPRRPRTVRAGDRRRRRARSRLGERRHPLAFELAHQAAA